jgi:hypothetical protein
MVSKLEREREILYIYIFIYYDDIHYDSGAQRYIYICIKLVAAGEAWICSIPTVGDGIEYELLHIFANGVLFWMPDAKSGRANHQTCRERDPGEILVLSSSYIHYIH